MWDKDNARTVSIFITLPFLSSLNWPLLYTKYLKRHGACVLMREDKLQGVFRV